jgi:diphthamide biosynthesis protein 7
VRVRPYRASPADSRSTGLQARATDAAVLDLHFSPHDPAVLSVALSAGTVELYVLCPAASTPLERFKRVRLVDPEILVLALAWCPDPGRPTTLAAALSDGKVLVLDHASQDPVAERVQGHTREAWTVAWAPQQDAGGAYGLYSGGDDSCLISFKVNLGPDYRSSHTATHDAQGQRGDGSDGESEMLNARTEFANLDRRIHGAGVTAILPLPAELQTPQAILTGSYDEFVRVLVPDMKHGWSVRADRRLGGGVWRLELLRLGDGADKDGKQGNDVYVLASCMHAGTRVLKISLGRDQDWSIDVLARFEEHESMNYGSHATILTGQNGQGKETMTVASTSFYDKMLCIWPIPASLGLFPHALATWPGGIPEHKEG